MNMTSRLLRSTLIIAVGLSAATASAAPPKAPYSLMAELNSLCVETKAEPAAIVRAAKARGYRQLKPNEFLLIDGFNSVNLTIDRTKPFEHDTLGAIVADSCVLIVHPANERDIDELFAWLHLGKAPVMQHYTFTISESRTEGRQVIKGNTIRQLDAMRRGSIRMIMIERLPGAVRTFYMRPRSTDAD